MLSFPQFGRLYLRHWSERTDQILKKRQKICSWYLLFTVEEPIVSNITTRVLRNVSHWRKQTSRIHRSDLLYNKQGFEQASDIFLRLSVFPSVRRQSPKVGVLKKLSLAGLAKLIRLRYRWLRFGLASAGYCGLGVHDRPVYSVG
jgi:hypothetical protein